VRFSSIFAISETVRSLCQTVAGMMTCSRVMKHDKLSAVSWSLSISLTSGRP